MFTFFGEKGHSYMETVSNNKYTIAVAGTGYVGLSIATLLSQHNKVYAVDIIPEKVELINQRKSPDSHAGCGNSLYRRGFCGGGGADKL